MSEWRGGQIIVETAEETAAHAQPAPSTELEAERQRRAVAAEAEARARWQRAVASNGLLRLMELVEQRLKELPEYTSWLARRRALLPAVIAIAQDAKDCDLSGDLRAQVHRLHARIQAEDPLVSDAPAARRLLDVIRRYEFDREPDENGIVPGSDVPFVRGWTRELGWYSAPLPDGRAELLACERELARLEGATLKALRARRRG
jgi:hypothetical protein